MRSAFEAVLKELEAVGKDIEKQIDERVASYHYQGPIRIEDPISFKRVIAEFYAHLMGLEKNQLNDDLLEGCRWRAENLLSKNMRTTWSPSETVFSAQREGIDGGMRGVFKTLALVHLGESRDSLIGGIVSGYYNGATTDELLQDARDYFKAYKKFLNKDVIEDGWGVIAAHFQQTLKDHPRMIAEFRN